VTGELNLHHPCGPPSVPCWVSSTTKQQLFILKLTGWSRGFIDSLKTLYELGWRLLIGTVIYLGFSLVFVLLREKIQPRPLLRLFTVQIWSFLTSSYRTRILPQPSSTRILKTRCRVFVQFLLVTTLPEFQFFNSRFQCPWQLVLWFWFAKMDMFLLCLLFTKDLIKF